MKKFAGFRTKTIDRPIQILHPALLVPQKPVVNSDEFVRYLMRFFDRFHYTNRCRFAKPKTLDTFDDRNRRRAMSAAGIG